MSIKPRKKTLTVELKDGTVLHTENSLKQLQTILGGKQDFIQIDGILFNKYEFKKAYERNVDSIEGFILAQTKEVQIKIREREKTKKSKIGKGFQSIQEVENFISKL